MSRVRWGALQILNLFALKKKKEETQGEKSTAVYCNVYTQVPHGLEERWSEALRIKKKLF